MLDGEMVGKQLMKEANEVVVEVIPTQTPDRWANIWATLLLFSFMVPAHLAIRVSGLRFSAYRVVILLAILSALIRYSQCKTKASADKYVFLIAVFMLVSLVVNDGLSAFAYALSQVLETVGPYFIARAFINDKQKILLFIKSYYVFLLLIFLPVLYETLTSHNLFGVDLGRDPEAYRRFGFYRASGPFDHPILCGLFLASGISLIYISSKKRTLKYIPLLLEVLSTVSTAAFLMVALQWFFFAYKKLVSYSLSTYLAFLSVVYVIVDIVSNRPPLTVLASYLSLDAGSAYDRVLQLRFGSDNVANNPFLGIGSNDWVRPEWMGPSIDNFYLFLAITYGLPALICTLYVIVLALRATFSDEQSDLHMGFRILLVTFAISIYSVHLWGAVYIYFWMIVGICVNLQFIKVDNSSVIDGHRSESPGVGLQYVKG